MRGILMKLRRNEDGATAIEYGLIAALLAIGVIGAVQAVRGSLQNTFNKVSNELNTANN
jgi:pilus assembly protein Flp/PilA